MADADLPSHTGGDGPSSSATVDDVSAGEQRRQGSPGWENASSHEAGVKEGELEGG